MLNDEEYFRQIYKELCHEFGDDFLKEPEESVFDKKITAQDIAGLPYEKIDAIQKEHDKGNCRDIFKALMERRLNQDEAQALFGYFRDGMAGYREVYRGIYEVFGRPEHIACMNPDTGELETHVVKSRRVDAKTGKVLTFRENVVSDYTLKEVTPFTCMRLEYRDDENNPVYVVFPVMKKASRAIEKIEDYHTDYMQDVRAANERFSNHQDRKCLQEELDKIKKPEQRVTDILRLTVTRKYYSGVSQTQEEFNASPRLGINPAETRSLFYENDMKNSGQLQKSKNNYYDNKCYFYLSSAKGQIYKAEAQIKIHTFYKSDFLTHDVYGELRRIDENLKRNKNHMKELEIRRDEYRVALKRKEIQKINKEANHQYNMQVLDKVRWLEDGYHASCIKPDYPDGTYEECRKLIENDYMVRPFKAFDVDKEFNPDDKENIKIATRDNFNLKAVYEISQRYQENISRKYRHCIPGTRYDAKKDKTDWDEYGKSRKFRADMNQNIYKENYENDYWNDYDAAEKEVRNKEKNLTRRQIRMYHNNVSKKRDEVKVSLTNEALER